MIRPGVAAPNLAPLLGREVVRERSGVRYHELRTRSLLNRCQSPRVPFDWTVNPYRGCAMGCRYCYAAYTHEFLGASGNDDFHSVIYVKTGAEEETARRLPAIARRGQLVALGTATDPYQPGEADLRVTRRFLEAAAAVRGLRLGITTKGAVVLRDIDLLQRIHERSALSIHVSLISLDADLLRRLEPLAPPPAVRIEVMARLAAAGLLVGLSVSPVLPALTDDEAGLEALVSAAARAGVKRLASQLLFLRSPTKEKYLRWVAAEFPRYLEAYRQAYESRVYLGGRYRERVRSFMARLRARYGLGTELGASASLPPLMPAPTQLPLWTPASSP
jgi:DNA repair photolyase